MYMQALVTLYKKEDGSVSQKGELELPFEPPYLTE